MASSCTDKITIHDLPSFDQTAVDGNDRYFLGLCTLFVATIEDAKDRISQLELVFCDQLFPALQKKIRESCLFAQASEDLRRKDCEEWKSNKEALLLEFDVLRSERDSLLQTQASLRTEIHDLQCQLQQHKESNEKFQTVESKARDGHENVDLPQECNLQSSSELDMLLSKMRSSSSLGSSTKFSENNLDVEKTEETNNDYLSIQLSSAIERERKRTQAVLTKFKDLRKSYRSLRKQYTVLFRRTHPLGHHCKDEIFPTIEEKKEFCNEEDEPRENRTTSWRCIKASKTHDKSADIGSPKDGYKGLSQSEGIANEGDSDHILIQQLSGPVQKSDMKVVSYMHGNEDHGEFLMDDFIGHSKPLENSNVYPLMNLHEDESKESEKAHQNDDLRGHSGGSGLSKLQEVTGERITIDLDQASQVGYSNVVPLALTEQKCDSHHDKLEEVVGSCEPGVSIQNNQMEKSFEPFKAMHGAGKKQKTEEAGWFPVQKRLLSGGSHPKTAKIMRTNWRNTRAERRGFDPHDDFLDTPLENILQGMERTNNMDENGDAKHEQPIDSSGKAVSFSQVSTQAPNGFHEDANRNSEEQNEQMTLKFIDSSLENRRPSIDRKSEANVEPTGINDKNKYNASAVIRAKPLLSKSGPMYKYVEPVRKRDEREKLQGVECNQCKKFYDAVLTNNGSGVARCEHHDAVSRHRYRYIPPSTPDGFWNIGFDSDQ